MNERSFFTIHNGEPKDFNDVPLVDFQTFQSLVIDAVESGKRICSLFAHTARIEDKRLIVALGNDDRGFFELLSTPLATAYSSLTPVIPQLHLFERELVENNAIQIDGHPWLKPVRFPGRQSPDSTGKHDRIGITDYFAVLGESLHEVAVGPVHAGIIEPGHFRFQCHGEEVFHLEISLGYQHRGIETAIKTMTGPRRRAVMEAIAGDTTIGHTMAYCQNIESLSGANVSMRGHCIRACALELERCANHVGDLGALAGDVGYLPGSSFCGRIRGDYLNLSAQLCGSRFGRGLVVPGGVGFDVDGDLAAAVLKKLREVFNDSTHAIELILNNSMVQARFEYIGILTKESCRDLGIVGPAARASGLARDVRHNYPSGMYRFANIPFSGGIRGDIFDRAMVRWLEVQKSVKFVEEQLQSLPIGECCVASAALAPDTISIAAVEGWRGEIFHSVITDDKGEICHYKVIDPSFHNWIGLAMALRGMQISDFPLCNKSFNLSYCGHDL